LLTLRFFSPFAAKVVVWGIRTSSRQQTARTTCTYLLRVWQAKLRVPTSQILVLMCTQQDSDTNYRCGSLWKNALPAKRRKKILFIERIKKDLAKLM